MKTTIISLGGSIIFPDDKINAVFLKKFKSLIANYAKNGNKFAIICGGGGLSRKYMDAAKKISKIDGKTLDCIGIAATYMNASFVKNLFAGKVYEEVVSDYDKKIKTNKKIIVGSGWKPGRSTDYDAVLMAKMLKVKTIINLSNIEYAYTKDPRKYKDAEKIEKTSWKDFRKIVGNKWSPRLSMPFDPIAAKLAQKLKLKVIIAKGSDLKNLKKILNGKKFKGTVIK